MIPLAATNWQTSAASFELQRIPAQVLTVDVPTRQPQRVCARRETGCLPRRQVVTGPDRQSPDVPNVFATKYCIPACEARFER
jgi:hypothetical protein